MVQSCAEGTTIDVWHFRGHETSHKYLEIFTVFCYAFIGSIAELQYKISYAHHLQ